MEINGLTVAKCVDKITDWIPLVSTIKNGGILLYQYFHTAVKEPAQMSVTPSWRKNIKIQVLSKNDFRAGVALIPVIGNLGCLVKDVAAAVRWSYRDFRGKSDSFLHFKNNLVYVPHYCPSLAKHRKEVAMLHVVQNKTPERTLCDILDPKDQNDPLIGIVLHGKTNWSPESLKVICQKGVLEWTKTALTHSPQNDFAGASALMQEISNLPLDRLDDSLNLADWLLDGFAQSLDVEEVLSTLLSLASVEKSEPAQQKITALMDKVIESEKFFKNTHVLDELKEGGKEALFAAIRGNLPEKDLCGMLSNKKSDLTANTILSLKRNWSLDSLKTISRDHKIFKNNRLEYITAALKHTSIDENKIFDLMEWKNPNHLPFSKEGPRFLPFNNPQTNHLDLVEMLTQEYASSLDLSDVFKRLTVLASDDSFKEDAYQEKIALIFKKVCENREKFKNSVTDSYYEGVLKKRLDKIKVG